MPLPATDSTSSARWRPVAARRTSHREGPGRDPLHFGLHREAEGRDAEPRPGHGRRSIVSTYLEITDADRILAVLPFSFDAGMNQLMTAFQQGGDAGPDQLRASPERSCRRCCGSAITGLAGVPTLWSLLAQPSSPCASSRSRICATSPTPAARCRRRFWPRCAQLLPTTRIFLMYGLTEAFRSTYLPPDELDRRPTSMGKAIPTPRSS